MCPINGLIRSRPQLTVCVLYKVKEGGGKVTVSMHSYEKMGGETCDVHKMAAIHTAIRVPSMHDHYISTFTSTD